MTPKRKRALSYLQEWAEQQIDVEYSSGSGVIIAGTVNTLDLDDRHASFLFRNDFGIHSILSTDLFEQVEITEIGTLPVRVGFYRKDASAEGFSIAPKHEASTPRRDIARVHEIFRGWEKLDQLLMMNTGNGMQSTLARCKVKEVSGQYIFTIAETETVQLVSPERSTAIQIEEDHGVTTLTLFDQRSGSYFTVSSRLEKLEDVIDRFGAMTTCIQ